MNKDPQVFLGHLYGKKLRGKRRNQEIEKKSSSRTSAESCFQCM